MMHFLASSEGSTSSVYCQNSQLEDARAMTGDQRAKRLREMHATYGRYNMPVKVSGGSKHGVLMHMTLSMCW